MALIVWAISFSCSLAILLGLVLGLGVENILWNPISWFFGGILLLFLSSFFYLVYCAVCAIWFPTREPGYPFERTQNDETFRYSQYGNPYDRTQNFEEELFDDILEDESVSINDDETISLNDADDDLGVIDQDEEDLSIEDTVDVSMDEDD